MTKRTTEEAPAKAGAVGPTQEQLETLRSLTKDQIERLRIGQAVTTQSGATVSFEGDPLEVAGEVIGVATVTPPAPTKASRYGKWLESRSSLIKTLAKHKLPAEVHRAIAAHDCATQEVLSAAAAGIREREERLAQAIELAAALPAGVKSASASASAKSRHKSNPVKAAAIELWPVAHRNGWTAYRMHLELTRRGHKAAPGTVAKWMTELRKTGTC